MDDDHDRGGVMTGEGYLVLLAIADWADHAGYAEVSDEDLEAVCATPAASLIWYEQWVDAMRSGRLSPEDQAAFEEWDNTQVGPGKGHRSSDWPGWARYLPPPPWKFRDEQGGTACP